MRFAAAVLVSWLALTPTTDVAAASATQQTAPRGAALLAARLPRVVYRGGLFLRHPRVVTITFAGDEAQRVARLERFGDTIPRSAWWRRAIAGYCATADDCMGNGRPGASVRLTEELPGRIHGVDISALLRRKASAGQLGKLDPETVLMVYLPAGVILHDAYNEHFCNGGPRAFHRALRYDNKLNGYSVLPRCGEESVLTATASHELIELATNPDTAHRGFALDQRPASHAFAAAGVEPMDPCGLLTRDTHRTVAAGFTVQRAWSNRAAELGKDPCGTTSAKTPHVALVPRKPALLFAGIGDRATLTLDATSDRPGTKWKVAVVYLSRVPPDQRHFAMELDRATVVAGQVVTLTIELREVPPGNTATIGLVSTLGEQVRLWPLTLNVR